MVPTSQNPVLPVTRVGASGFFNGTGLLLTGGTVNTVGVQSSPLAPPSFFPTGKCFILFVLGQGGLS